MGALFIAEGVCAVKPVPHLVSPVPVFCTLHPVSPLLQAFAKIPVLHFSVVHCYNSRKTWVAPYNGKEK